MTLNTIKSVILWAS